MLDHEASAAGLRKCSATTPLRNRFEDRAQPERIALNNPVSGAVVNIVGAAYAFKSGFGTVVQCLDPKNESCLTPKTDKASCDQATGGNCGYYVSYPTYVTPEEVSVSCSIALACSYWSCPTVVVVVVCLQPCYCKSVGYWGCAIATAAPGYKCYCYSDGTSCWARAPVKCGLQCSQRSERTRMGKAYCLNNCGGNDNAPMCRARSDRCIG